MTQIIDVEVMWDSCVELLPLEINQEGDECLVGRRQTDSYLAINDQGMQVIAMFRLGQTKEAFPSRCSHETSPSMFIDQYADHVMAFCLANLHTTTEIRATIAASRPEQRWQQGIIVR
jgi:hypothetical protein